MKKLHAKTNPYTPSLSRATNAFMHRTVNKRTRQEGKRAVRAYTGSQHAK